MNRQWYYAALALVLIGLLIHQPLLLLVGTLALLILLSADTWATYCLRNLRYRREVSERRALFGEEITLSASLENAKLLPLPWLEVEETVPRSLTFAGRNVRVQQSNESAVLESLFSLRWYERVTRRYTITCMARGVHSFGPTTLRSGDVFGFQSRQETLANREYLLVYPMVVPLTSFNLPARHPFGDFSTPRRLLEDPARVVGVRDYQYGDDLRRVHWKATARAMQLQSKIYQPTTTYTMAIFLNVAQQLDVWFGIHPELLELSICAAASVASWALDDGLAVGLYANTTMYMPELGMALPRFTGKPGTQDQPNEKDEQSKASEQDKQPPSLQAIVAEQLNIRRIHLPPASNEDQRRRILETLARIQSYFGSPMQDLIQAERTRLPAGATVVLITSSISDPLLDTLARMRNAGHAVTILFVGDTPIARHLAGIQVYHIGGEATWKQFQADYEVKKLSPEMGEKPSAITATGQPQLTGSFHL
jgi:uncharacterized protein (DUF58 family)